MPNTPATPWYREAFQEGYLDLYGHRDLAEAARAVRWLAGALKLEPGLRLLDLCCGPGRHLFFIGQLVREAIGLDLSRVLLHGAREHWHAGQSILGSRAADRTQPDEQGRVWDLGLAPADRREQPARLIQGTMGSLPFATASFDRVVNLFTSFGYYEEEARNTQVLHEVSRVLRPGGQLAIDHINREALLAGLRPQSERRLPNGRQVREERHWDAQTQRVIKQVTTREPAGGERHWRESVRVYAPEELEQLLVAAGLHPMERYGDYDGRAWSPEAPRLIILAERRI